MKENFENNENYKNFLRERAVRPPGIWGNVTLIHLMLYKPQIFKDEVLQYVFDKYVITYQIIWERRGQTYWKVRQFCTIFYTKNIFLVVA